MERTKNIILLDNNILAHEHGIRQIEKLINANIKIDFNQGLDARIALKNNYIELLSKVKVIKYYRFACDTKAQISVIEKIVSEFAKYKIKPSKIFVYALITNNINESIERINFLRQLGVKPFCQPYISYHKKISIPQIQKDLARWCNHKAIFYSIDFYQYLLSKYNKTIVHQTFEKYNIKLCKSALTQERTQE